MKKIFRTVLVSSLSLVSLTAVSACGGGNTAAAPVLNNDGPWVLDNKLSSVSFVSTKKNTLAEAHSFTSISGDVTSGGEAVIMISLDTVSTNIDIRNSRMREYLFETAQYPFAKITASPDLNKYKTMKIGGRVADTVDVTVALHGAPQTYAVEVFVSRTGPDQVIVESKTPVIINAEEFGLDGGIEKLRTLANLPSISPAVPVSFSLLFKS